MSLQPLTDRHLGFDERQHLHEQALAEAQQLRREAIDDFWRGGNAFIGQLAMSAQRSATRLAHRLGRRRDRRSMWPEGFV